MSTKSKIAYLMHVDWDWIKQRPHFLYEELTRHYSMDLFYIHKVYDRHNKSIENSRSVHSNSRVSKFKKIPLSGRIKILQVIERYMNRKSIRSLNKYECLWVTSPVLLDFIPLNCFQGKTIIYDCMDDFLSFFPHSPRLGRLKALETSLIEHSNLIITSSRYLQRKMISSYREHMRSTPVVINNGISSTLLHSVKSRLRIDLLQVQTNKLTRNSLNFMYIGTIGEWIDFELILDVLHRIHNINFTMVGPIDSKVPSHPRLNFIGAVEHSQLPSYAAKADAFIMPFKVNELIRSVDPVKVYEYICFHKPIFAINYGEMQKFLPFVHLYSNEAELLNLIDDLQNDRIEMYSEEESIRFLQQNTWNSRCEQIVEILEGVLK